MGGNIPTFNGDIQKYLSGKNGGLATDSGQLQNNNWQDITSALGMDPNATGFQFQNGGNIYQLVGNDNGTRSVKQVDTIANQAQQAYQKATDTAVAGLKGQQGSLGQQYSDLLKTVTGEYQPLINQTTATAGAAESERGLTPDSQLFQQQVQGALQPVYGQEAANAQQIGLGSVADMNSLATNIANLQAGVAGTAAGLPLQYGSLQLSQAANIANIGLAKAQAQQASVGARYVAISGLGIYDLNSGQLMPNSSSTGLTTNGPTVTGVQFGK